MSDQFCNLATEAIRTHSQTKWLSVRVLAREDAVVIEGKVTSYYEKQMVQEVVKQIDGVKRIQNDLEVVARPNWW